LEVADFTRWFHVELGTGLFHVEPFEPNGMLQRSISLGRATIAALFYRKTMISLARYVALLEPREMRQLFAASVLGRLPIGITGLAILLLIQSASGSFATGGTATGCYVAGLALVAPFIGRLIDRYGPRRILTVCGLLFPAALCVLAFGVSRAFPAWLLFALAATAGATFPPITVCMRTLLKRRLGEETLLSTAYSLESVLIELIFIVGPMLVALLVAVASPAVAVVTAAACGCMGTALFLRLAALRAWHIEPAGARRLLGALAEPGFAALIGVILCYSIAFGLTEIGVAAYASEIGTPSLAGVLLGLMSVGSAAGGLAYGSRGWPLPLARQFAAMLGLMGVGLAWLALPWNPWLFAIWSVLAGVVMAPALIIQSMLVARTSRPEYSTEAFTWSASALLAGVGLGLTAGGGLLEVFASGAALTAGAVAAFLGALVAWLALRRDAR
jgi:MFS family permease